MSDVAQIAAPDLKAQELQRAFDVFNQVSLELTQAYEGLQARVESLTSELAVANGELRRQYQEKEALSERKQALMYLKEVLSERKQVLFLTKALLSNNILIDK